MKSCPSMIAILITDTLTCGKVLQNDLQWLIKVLANIIMFKHRIGAADAATNEEDKAITTAFGKRFCIHWTLNC